jgi:hypothetical protein
MNQITEAVEILSATKEQIKNILTDPIHENHSLMQYLSFITGTGDLTPKKEINLPAATTIAGQTIQYVGKKKTFDTTPEEEAVSSLREKANRAYESFLNLESKDIRKNFDPITIRAVAKKAGMKNVTMDEPVVIDVRFIDQIKAEIVKAEQFKLEQGELRIQSGFPNNKSINVEPGHPVMDRQEGVIGTDEVESAFDDDKSTSADVPDTVEEIEQLREAREAEKTEAAKTKATPKKK